MTFRISDPRWMAIDAQRRAQERVMRLAFEAEALLEDDGEQLTAEQRDAIAALVAALNAPSTPA